MGARVALDMAQCHYLLHVMRWTEGEDIRVFNGVEGEYRARCQKISKTMLEGVCTQKLREQTRVPAPVHVIFSPIQKQRMDFLIEKAVELGVTAFHPVLMARTQGRTLNFSRLESQIVSSAEQCERLDLPVVHPVVSLKDKIVSWQATPVVHWAIERRHEVPDIRTVPQISAILVGPEGGFDPQESSFLNAQGHIRPVSLGERILRAETAVLKCLSHMGA